MCHVRAHWACSVPEPCQACHPYQPCQTCRASCALPAESCHASCAVSYALCVRMPCHLVLYPTLSRVGRVVLCMQHVRAVFLRRVNCCPCQRPCRAERWPPCLKGGMMEAIILTTGCLDCQIEVGAPSREGGITGHSRFLPRNIMRLHIYIFVYSKYSLWIRNQSSNANRRVASYSNLSDSRLLRHTAAVTAAVVAAHASCLKNSEQKSNEDIHSSSCQEQMSRMNPAPNTQPPAMES